MSRQMVDDGHGEQNSILLARCREAIKKSAPAATVILYGSRARGDAKPVNLAGWKGKLDAGRPDTPESVSDKDGNRSRFDRYLL